MTPKWIILIFSLSIFVFSSSSVFSQVTYTEISGTVKYRGIIVPNLPVTVTNIRRTFTQTKKANNNGFFKFDRLPVDKYTIRADSPTLGSILIKVFPKIGMTQIFDIDFEINTSPGSIKGIVTDRDEKAIGKINVIYVSKDDPNEKIEIETDQNGNFIIPELPQGKYILIFEAEGFKSKTKEVKVEAAEKKVNVELKRN